MTKRLEIIQVEQVERNRQEEEVIFKEDDDLDNLQDTCNDALVILASLLNFWVKKIWLIVGALLILFFYDAFKQIGIDNAQHTEVHTLLTIPTPVEVDEAIGNRKIARECYAMTLEKIEEHSLTKKDANEPSRGKAKWFLL